MFFIVVMMVETDEELINQSYDTREEAQEAFNILTKFDWVVDVSVEMSDAARDEIVGWRSVDEMRIRPDEV